MNYKKGDKVYQLLAHGWWFSPCTPASSTNKNWSPDIAEILLKVALNTNKSINQSIMVAMFLGSQDDTRATQSVANPLAVKPLKNYKVNCDLDL